MTPLPRNYRNVMGVGSQAAATTIVASIERIAHNATGGRRGFVQGRGDLGSVSYSISLNGSGSGVVTMPTPGDATYGFSLFLFLFDGVTGGGSLAEVSLDSVGPFVVGLDGSGDGAATVPFISAPATVDASSDIGVSVPGATGGTVEMTWFYSR